MEMEKIVITLKRKQNNSKCVFVCDIYFDSDQFPLQWFSIRKLLSEAQVDGVIRRTPSVLSKIHQI